MGYDPKNPMEGRITDLGPRSYTEMLPPVIAANKGNGTTMRSWLPASCCM